MLPQMRIALALIGLLAGCATQASPKAASTPPAPVERVAGAGVDVRIKPGLVEGPLDGRLLVLVTQRDSEEPRFQVTDGDDSAQVFGLDVEGWDVGKPLDLTGDVAGYPLPALGALPPGDYIVQALVHRYETFRRGDGKTVKLPLDRGEGQQWNLAPGNLLSTPAKVRVAPGARISLELDHLVPPLPELPETKLLRRVTFQSELLSKFWGRPTSMGAIVILPEGWDSHPQARYPVIIAHSHFDREVAGWRETPPDDSLPAVDLDGLRRDCPNGHGPKCAAHGYARYMQEAAYRFYRQWTAKGFPRVILVQIGHANPYYDDSYAVNSENVGPYGDAITHELLPFLEQRFRGLGPWARGLYGGSTGGWEAIAAQVLYPDEYNGAIANCPDPIDFRAYMSIDIYDHENAFYSQGPFRRTPRPSSRNPDATTRSTVAQDNAFELALGTRSRSGQQFDIWEAVFSPVGADGYPQRIFDKRTGVIDKAVAAYWREHYDLGDIVTRDWARLGPKLAGKLWINVGELDTYFLQGAVHRFEERLRGLKDPTPDVRIQVGARDGHCWSGDREHMNFESRMTYHARFIPLLVSRFLKSAPKGADVRSWRY